MANRVTNLFTRISLGVVLVLFWAFVFIKADQLFPANTEQWKSLLTMYMVFASLVFSFNALASERTEKPLFRISFLKAFPKFLIGAGVSLVVLFLFGALIRGDAFPSIFGAVSGIGLGVILFHALFVATIEELVFRGWLPNELLAGTGIGKMTTWIVSAIIFASFHWVVGGEITLLLIYIPLGLAFSFAKERWSPKTNMTNIGMHFAWNVWILGFIAG